MAKKNTTTANPYKVGDIVTTTWGYSMTLVDFYEVIRTTACKVELRQLQQNEDMTGYLSGETTPRLGEYEEPSNAPYSVHPGQLCKVREDGCILIPAHFGWGGHDFNYARKWNGQPRHFNHCD